MGLILLSIGLLIFAYLLYTFAEKYIKTTIFESVVEAISFLSLVTGLTVLILCIAFFVVAKISSPGEEAKYIAKREALVFQLENKVYEYQANGIDLDSVSNGSIEGFNVNNNQNQFILVEGKRELYKEISEFNETINSYKCNRKNFWVNIFVPKFWENIEPIPLQ